MLSSMRSQLLKNSSGALCKNVVVRARRSFSKDSGGGKYEVVFMRHGESTWNLENKFTGWYDCPLSPKGHVEAEAAGKLLKQGNYKFDIAYTSMLQRAVRTLWHTLEATDCMTIPIVNAWELNERHYGALQGMYILICRDDRLDGHFTYFTCSTYFYKTSK